MANNSQNENIDVGLNLSGNALGTVQQLTDRMVALRAVANDLGTALKNVNKELSSVDDKQKSLNKLPTNRTIKNMRQQIDNMSTSDQVMFQRYYQNLSRSNQAAQFNNLINSPKDFTNRKVMNGVLQEYNPQVVNQALKTRLDIAQLNGNIKKAQEAQRALDVYQSTMLELNTKLKGVATMKRLQDQATIDFLNQPMSQMSVTQNTYGRLNRGFKSAAEEKAIRQYMANPSTLKPTSDPYAATGNVADSQRALQENANKIAAAQRLMGQTSLMDDSAARTKQLRQQTEMLGKLEEERVKLQAISNLRRANLKNTDAQLQSIKKASSEAEKNKRLEETLNGSLKTKTLTADNIARMSPEDLILREAAMVKRLSQAKQAMHQADTLGNAKAKKESEAMVVAYQKEVDMIRRRNQEEKASSRNMTADRFRDLSSGESSGALLGIQGILMRNYMLWGGLLGAITGSYAFLRDYELALKQTQAISQATDTQMVKLSESILSVAENSRFSAIEITEASTVLAQAGFSVADIEKTLESVTLLATATGSTLKETVDIATASLGAFQLSAENMPRIVNQITQAMNLSKLDIQKFQLAVQYAGNAASDAGLDFEELLASVATVANAGVRSGSTLGTGFRQLLSDMIAPSAKFQAILQRLGLTAADVDVRTQGLTGALKVLREAGFTTADAYESFEVRAVAFYTALSNNLATYDSLSANLDNNTAAMDANEVQMDSLAAQTDRMFNQFKALAEVAGGGVREALKDVFHVIGDLAALLRDVLDSQIAKTVLQFATMTAALTGGIYLVKGMTGAMVGLIGLLPTLTRGVTTLGTATALTLPHFVAIAALVSAAVIAFQHFTRSGDDLQKSLERSQTSLNEFKDATANLNGQIAEVDKKIVSLESRFESLKDDPGAVSVEMFKLKERATELGITLGTELVNSIDSVRNGWEELRISLGKELVMNLDNQIAELQNLAFLTAQMNTEELRKKGSPFTRQAAEQGGYDKAYDFNTLEELKPLGGRRQIRAQAVLGRNALPNNMGNFLNSISQANKAGGGRGDGTAIGTLADQVYQDALDAQNMSSEELAKALPAMTERSNRLMTILNRARTQYKNKARNTKLTDEQSVAATQMVNSINGFAETFQAINNNVKRMASLAKEQRTAETDRMGANASVDIQTDLQKARANGTANTALGNKAIYGNAASLVNPSKAKTLNRNQRQRLEDVMPIIREASAKYGVPEDFIIAQMITESSLSDNKSIRGKNSDGTYTSAVGLMQVTKAAAADVGFNYEDIYSNDRNNIMAGAAYAARMKKQVGGTWEDAARAYYMGAGGLNDYRKTGRGAQRYKESNDYVSKIFSNMYGYQQTGGRARIVGEVNLPDNTVESLNDMAALKQMLDFAQNEFAAKYSGDIAKLAPADQIKARELSAKINAFQTEINRLADQTNNVIRSAQAEDQALRKEKQDEEKLQIEKIKAEVQEAESNLKQLEGREGKMPYQQFVKEMNAAYTNLEGVKARLIKAESAAQVNAAVEYNGKNLTLKAAVAEIADLKLNSDLNKLDTEISSQRRKALEDAAKSFAKRITDQNKTFVEEVRNAIAEGSEEYNRATKAAEFQNQAEVWGIEDELGLPEMRASRALMDDPRYRDNYSDVQRQAMSEKIEKTGLQAFQIANENALKLQKSLLEARMSEVLSVISAYEMEQKELQTELLVEANKIQDEELRKATINTINKEQAKLSADLTKNNAELVDLQVKLRDLDTKLMNSDAGYQSTPYGIGEEIKRITSKAVADQNTAAGRSADVQKVLGGINGAFNELISTAMAASDNVDDFFKILTGGSKESKEAFKAFGYSIVQTVVKVLQDRMVTRFVDLMSDLIFGKEGSGASAGTRSWTGPGQSERTAGGGGISGWITGGLNLLASVFTGAASSGAFASGGGATSFAGIGADATGTYGMFDQPINFRSQGGLLRGGGGKNVDNIPVMGADMEYVMPSKVTDTVGLGTLEFMRKDPKGFMDSKFNLNTQQGDSKPAAPAVTNVYAVLPQNVPKTVNKNDIIVAITDDVARNGQLKTLIKSVVSE